MTEASNKLAGLSSAKRALLEKLVAERRAAAGTIQPRPRPERLPLSFGQERLWVVDQLAPGKPTYNVPLALWLDGALDEAALDRAIVTLVERHEALRTTIPSEEGRPYQRIASDARIDIQIADAATDAEALALGGRFAHTPFELTKGPLVRALRVRVGAERQLLVLLFHHIVVDGWSLGVLLGELTKIYNSSSPLPPPALQYADFTLWQRDYLSGERMDKQVAYWREHLDGCPSVIDLPSDRPRPPVQSFNGGVARVDLPPDLYDAMEAFSRDEEVTPFMTMYAVLATLLHRWTAQSDIPIGVGMAARGRAELEPVVGFFVNTLVMRASLGGEPAFRDLLARVREATLGAQAHQDAPLSKVLDSMKIERSASHMPFLQVMLFFQNYAQDVVAMTGLQTTRVPFDHLGVSAAQSDLVFILNQEGRGQLMLQYSADLFDKETIERMLGHFVVLLRGAIAAPERAIGELPMLTDAELAQLAAWNDTRLDYPKDSPIIDLIAAQAERTPDAVAVTFRDRDVTYRELLARGRALGDELHNRGVGPGSLVGLYVDRSVEMLIALLGVLDAGGAYVPLDPSYPADRLAYMLEAAEARVVVTTAALRGSVPVKDIDVILADANSELMEDGQSCLSKPKARPDDLAYVIFTSGSTGRPKGVQISQRSAVNLLTSVAQQPGMHAGDTICAVSTLSFDIALFELVLPLTVGAHILLADRDTARDGHALAKLVDARDVTIMQATPATWRMLLDIGWKGRGWTGKRGIKLITTGEACPRELADRLLPCCRELWNLYGPTETTVYSALGPIVEGSGPISIGKPVANTQIHIVDRNMQLLPVGVPGELLIGGDGLARGYLGRPDLSSEKFIPDPFASDPNARLYRAGDLATWRPDGTLEVLGRMDHQVKLRGFRIELGEIEAALGDLDGIEQAVVHCREDRPGDKRLVAYVKGGVTEEAMRAHLRRLLPDYMIPAAFVVLEEFPLTPNGKVDRKALPAPESLAASVAIDELPQTKAERQVASIWSELLGRPTIGRNANFFDLGGHSLLATQLIARLERTFGIELSLRVLFERPTLAALAAHAADLRDASLGGEELEGLLAELEGLSEEEALGAVGSE